MTRKDYELVAKLIREGLDVIERHEVSNDAGYIGGRSALWRFTTNFAAEAGAENPRFDRDRFLTAAGFDTLKRINYEIQCSE